MVQKRIKSLGISRSKQDMPKLSFHVVLKLKLELGLVQLQSSLSCFDLWLSFTLCAFNLLFIGVKHIHLEPHSQRPIMKDVLRYDSLLLFGVGPKHPSRLPSFLSFQLFFLLPVSLSLSVRLPTMQPINSAACLVISSWGQTENVRWGRVPRPLYAPDCRKSPPQRSHLHAGDLMNYRRLFMPLKARWVTTL